MAGGRREGIWKLGTFMGGYRELSILRIDWPSHRFAVFPGESLLTYRFPHLSCDCFVIQPHMCLERLNNLSGRSAATFPSQERW